jgi:hypothetical protein
LHVLSTPASAESLASRHGQERSLVSARGKVAYICILIIFLLVQNRNNSLLHEVMVCRRRAKRHRQNFQRFGDVETDIWNRVDSELQQRFENVAFDDFQV